MENKINKPTAIVTGKDAKRFWEKAKENKNKVISSQRMAEIKESANKLKSWLAFG